MLNLSDLSWLQHLLLQKNHWVQPTEQILGGSVQNVQMSYQKRDPLVGQKTSTQAFQGYEQSPCSPGHGNPSQHTKLFNLRNGNFQQRWWQGWHKGGCQSALNLGKWLWWKEKNFRRQCKTWSGELISV
jgi:hypothetical protein